MLQRKYRLSARFFRNVYQKGTKFRGNIGMLVVLNTDRVSNPQIGFVVSKKIGNAVQRHRMTRLLRQITFDILNQYDLQNTPLLCQYIAFKYSDSYQEIYKEYSLQILKAFGVNEKI